jgi:hypothetical protein
MMPDVDCLKKICKDCIEYFQQRCVISKNLS